VIQILNLKNRPSAPTFAYSLLPLLCFLLLQADQRGGRGSAGDPSLWSQRYRKPSSICPIPFGIEGGREPEANPTQNPLPLFCSSTTPPPSTPNAWTPTCRNPSPAPRRSDRPSIPHATPGHRHYLPRTPDRGRAPPTTSRPVTSPPAPCRPP
jgi:hypothetical protein